MEFVTEEYGGARFVVPDEPSVLDLLHHDSLRFALAQEENYILKLWEMAKVLISEWEAEALPDKDIDLKKVTDARAARLIEWAGIQVSEYRRSLDHIPKNS